MSVKSKEEIEIEFAAAISQAQELEELSNQLSNIAGSRFIGVLDRLSDSWQGENAAAFIKKGGEVSLKIYSAADDLNRVAKSIRSTAGIVYQAEKSAMMICY